MRASATPGVTYEAQVEPCQLSINVAMPVGLLVNEMLTNALKYAFVGRDNGHLKVVCRREGGQVTVMVSDDGIGMDEHVVWPSPRKLSALVLQTLRENTPNVKFDVASIRGQGTFMTLIFDQKLSRKLPN